MWFPFQSSCVFFVAFFWRLREMVCCEACQLTAELSSVTIVPLSHQQVSPWSFKGLDDCTKKVERCCFKPLQALQILSCCFLTGPTQPGTACLTLWLLMSESTCSLLPPAFFSPLFPPSLRVIPFTSSSELKRGRRKVELSFTSRFFFFNVSVKHSS